MIFTDTPLVDELTWPGPRKGGLDPSLEPAFLPTPGSPVAAKLKQPNVLLVTTGQQPGLFTGPLYTIHKALSARAVAAQLERRWQRPVVPVFWLAGDDHDHAEAAVTHWLAADGTLATGALPPRAAADPQRPLAREPLPGEIDELVARLAADLPDGPARDQVTGWLRRHYRVGATIAAAFGGALQEVLGPLGVVCFDPTHLAAKRAARATVERALGAAGDLDRRLVERMAALTAEGRAPDVRVGDGASLVFLDGVIGRDRLVSAPGGFRTRRGGERVPAAEMAALLESAPERFSPNVLLRPVVEAALLPTVAYVAGPGELRYLRLAEALYEPLGVEPQRPMPRWSGVVVEPRVTRTLEKFHTDVEQLAADPGAVEDRLLRRVAPADFDPAFQAIRAELSQGFERIVGVARTIDPTLEKPTTSTKGAALALVAELEKRLLAAQKRRQAELVAQLDRARAAIVPAGKPQERVLGLPVFWGRYGADFVGELSGHIEAWYRAALEGRPATP